MKFQRRNKTDGSSGDIATLNFHSWAGDLQDRVRAKTTEKDKGVMMMDRIKDRFGLTALIIEEQREKLKERELKDLEDMKRIARQKTERTIQWTRNEKGRIISPFDKKIKKDLYN